MKYVVIVGSTKSTVARKNVSCDVGKLLHEYGYRTTYLKIDPHLNYNVGRIEPGDNGEVYVLEDGAEVDLDLGVYERSCNIILTKDNYLTLGQVLYDAISKEKQGCYDTKVLKFEDSFTVALLDHVKRLSTVPVFYSNHNTRKIPDVMILDFGPNVVSQEMQFYTKAMCCLINILPSDDVAVVTVSPETETVNFSEQIINLFKTFEMKKDVLLFKVTNIIGGGFITRWFFNQISGNREVLSEAKYENMLSFYKMLLDCDFYRILSQYLNLDPSRARSLPKVKDEQVFEKKTVGIVTRYRREANPYASVEEALISAADKYSIFLTIVYINYVDLENNVAEAYDLLKTVDGILIPGGFGPHGVNSKIMVANYARLNNKPFLGICLGYQIAIIEFTRNVLKIQEATSSEFDPTTAHPVIKKLPNIVCRNTLDNIYLGSYPVEYREEALTDIYKKEVRMQKFRHRFALNLDYKQALEEKGMKFVGKNINDVIVMFKLQNHKFYVGVQYHPELSSTPESIDPVFISFIQSIKN